MDRSAAIEIQFNWIFVMIAGTIILAFFFLLISNITTSSSYETKVDVQLKMDSIMKSAISMPGVAFDIILKDIELSTETIPGSCGRGLYMDGDRNFRMDMGTFFSPSVIKSKSNRVFMWVHPWNVPFEVSNFLFVTNNDVHYIFVNETESGTTHKYTYSEKIFEDPNQISFPKELTKEFLNFGQVNQRVRESKNQKIRIIYFYDKDGASISPPIISYPEFYKDKDISALVVGMQKSGFDGGGSLVFYNQNADKTDWVVEDGVTGQKSLFFGKASIFAAIVAETRNIYECGMIEAFKDMYHVFEVYENRAMLLNREELSGRYEMKETCFRVMLYENSQQAFSSSRFIIKKILDDAPSKGFRGLESEFDQLHENTFDKEKGLVSYNHIALLQSCPTIY